MSRPADQILDTLLQEIDFFSRHANSEFAGVRSTALSLLLRSAERAKAERGKR
jgi:hypothetical protein